MRGKTISNERVDAAVRETVAARLGSDSPRREKSRLAASILFFEHGVYPSAKAVLECTQQGSLTDINRDVQEFWRDLREKTKVQLDAPALPDELLATFSEGLRAVWELANSRANEGLDSLRRDAADQVRVSEQRVEEARSALLLVEARIQEVEQELRGERERRETAETRAEVQSAEIESLNSSIEQWRSRLADETSARREAEERFSRDLEAERGERQREAERFQGEIRFAKQQIEEARASERRARDEVAVEIASLRQRLGRTEESNALVVRFNAELQGAKRALEIHIEDLQARLKLLAAAEAKRAQLPKSLSRRKSLR